MVYNVQQFCIEAIQSNDDDWTVLVTPSCFLDSQAIPLPVCLQSVSVDPVGDPLQMVEN